MRSTVLAVAAAVPVEYYWADSTTDARLESISKLLWCYYLWDLSASASVSPAGIVVVAAGPWQLRPSCYFPADAYWEFASSILVERRGTVPPTVGWVPDVACE